MLFSNDTKLALIPISILSIVLASNLMTSFEYSELTVRDVPNKGIKESAKNCLTINLLVLPFYISYFSFKLIEISSIKLDFSKYLLSLVSLIFLSAGGFGLIQHFFLRFILWKNRSIPWNYAHFLKYADDRKLINQVGGRFTFIHDKLQEHFARM